MPLYLGITKGPYGIDPADNGFKAWTEPPTIPASGQILPTAGLLYLYRMSTRSPQSISSAWVYLSSAGATLTNVGFALYTSGGTLLTSSVNANGATATAFQSSGAKQVTFTPQVINGDFYLGYWFTGSTMPSPIRSTATGGIMNIGLVAPNLRYASANTSLTTTAPGTFTTQTSLTNAWWAAVS